MAYNMVDQKGQVGLDYMIQTSKIFSNIPYITVAGNHESDLNYFQTAYPNISQNNKLYYSWDMGNIHLIGLYLGDENGKQFEFGSEYMNQQLIFLEENLTNANLEENRNKYPWIIVYMHHPIHCSATDEDCNIDSSSKMRNAVQVILEKHKVDLVIQSHAHQYERTYPMHSKSINEFKGLAQYDDGEYFQCEHEDPSFNNKCTIFKNPQGILYTLEGVAGTSHSFQENKYKLQKYTAYKGSVETKEEPGVLQTGYGIVTALSSKELLYEHFNTKKNKVVDAFRIYKSDIYNNWKFDVYLDDKIDYYSFYNSSGIGMKIFTIFIVIILLLFGILLGYIIVKRQIVRQENYSNI